MGSTCSKCSGSILASHKFCPGCGCQLRCKSCNAELDGVQYCTECGTASTRLSSASSEALNSYTYVEEQKGDDYSRHIELKASDAAVAQFGSFINQSFVPLRGAALQNNQTTRVPSAVIPILSHGNVIAPQGADAELEQAFDCVDGVIQVRIKDFKGKIQKEQQRRFMLLFSYAYTRLVSEELPELGLITTGARSISLFDKNWAKYLSSAKKEYFLQTSNGYKLSTPSIERAKEILKECVDAGVEGYKYWDKQPRSRKTITRMNKDTSSKINEWVTEPVELGKLDIRSHGTARDLALIGLWLVTKQLSNSDKLKPAEAYNYLKRKFSTIPITQKALTNAMSAETNKKYIERDSEGNYYLTIEGEALVKGWFELDPAIANQSK